MPTCWRVLDRIDGRHLSAIRGARAAARATARAAGAGPDLSGELHLDFDATITVANLGNPRFHGRLQRTRSAP
jgi:hypothetical protein